MMTMLSIILFLFISSFALTHAALQCYSCNPCGTTWNLGVANVIQTSTPSDYCRKTITGSLVVKDSTSTCLPINLPNNGVYCCHTDLCNTADRHTFKKINPGFLMILIWTIY